MDERIAIQPCGVAKLVAAVTGISVEASYDAAGLALCPRCNKAGTNPRYYPACSREHTRQKQVRGAEAVPLICDECGVFFYRLRVNINRDIKMGHGLPHVWCSHACQGKRMGQMNKGRQYKKNTHCPHGHLYDEQNTYSVMNKRGHQQRQCRTCNRLRYHQNKSSARKIERRSHDNYVTRSIP